MNFRLYEDEAFGTFEAVTREVYGRSQRRRPARRATIAPKSYEVTDDARVKCPCGVWNYTERIDGRAPRLPAVCWRCRKPL